MTADTGEATPAAPQQDPTFEQAAAKAHEHAQLAALLSGSFLDHTVGLLADVAEQAAVDAVWRSFAPELRVLASANRDEVVAMVKLNLRLEIVKRQHAIEAAAEAL